MPRRALWDEPLMVLPAGAAARCDPTAGYRNPEMPRAQPLHFYEDGRGVHHRQTGCEPADNVDRDGRLPAIVRPQEIGADLDDDLQDGAGADGERESRPLRA